MKRIVLSTLAAALLAVPAMQAEAAPFSSATVEYVAQKHYGDQTYRKKKVVKRDTHRWKRGDRYRDWRSHRAVDWRRHHLRRPAHGQQWIRVGNDYLLVSIMSGVIAGMIAAH
ncbi:MAG: RcnB family protein [Rhizobiales bacterium]|nr:RcnB family protein [Hyphomicrobiales bacterium]